MKRWRICGITAVLAFFLAVSGCGRKPAEETAGSLTGQPSAEMTEEAARQPNGEDTGEIARQPDGEDTGEIARRPDGEDTGEIARQRILEDGVYPILVGSSSSMFRITECQLTVDHGAMTAVMTMGGTGYEKLFMGTVEEAEKASEEDCIPYQEQADGVHQFQVPVEALDREIYCSAFSRRKQQWYERTIVFRSESLPQEAFGAQEAETMALGDGSYLVEVSLEGGSGRASVQSPTELRVENGKATAVLCWNSSNYDYMKVGEETFLPEPDEEVAVFLIPIPVFDQKISVKADTTAMSQPHEIEYTLVFHRETVKPLAKVKEGTEERLEATGKAETTGKTEAIGKTETTGKTEATGKTETTEKAETTGKTEATGKSEQEGRMLDLLYADQFSAEYRKDGTIILTIKDSGSFIIVPEGVEASQGLSEEFPVIHQPVDQIYLAATSAMDLFIRLGCVDRITLSGTGEKGWYLEEARQAMKNKSMVYAGKYNAPDYELILAKNCGLAVESTMIYHSPKVKEQLEKLGIPVLVERSSYESHPLGRMEWIKLYGVLLGKEELAEELFRQEVERLDGVMDQTPTGKTAAFFYITANGSVNVRKPGDYIAKIIALAGGSYVPQTNEKEESARSTRNMDMESFYAAARDTDYLIYNSTVDGELTSMEELMKKSPLLADFKAVKDGHVWCTESNMFQESMGLGNLILDIHRIFTEEEPDPATMTYLYPVR